MVQSKKQGKYTAVFNAVLCVFCICMCGSRNFHQVGGGGLGVEGPGPPDSKKLGQRCFVIFAVFLVLTFNLFNSFTEGTDPRVRWFIFWKTIIFQGSRRGPTFYGVGGRVQLFSGGGGVQMLISVETYCDFPWTPYPLSVSAHVLPSLVAGTQ